MDTDRIMLRGDIVIQSDQERRRHVNFANYGE